MRAPHGRGDTVVTAGGRVLAVTGTAATIDDARAVAYRAADRITFEGKTYRRDIGAHAGSRGRSSRDR